MRDKIESIALQYNLTDAEASQLTDELLDSFSVRLSLSFAEWIDINGIRDGRHEWKYKGDNYSKKWTTQQIFDEWQKVSFSEA